MIQKWAKSARAVAAGAALIAGSLSAPNTALAVDHTIDLVIFEFTIEICVVNPETGTKVCQMSEAQD